MQFEFYHTIWNTLLQTISADVHLIDFFLANPNDSQIPHFHNILRKAMLTEWFGSVAEEGVWGIIGCILAQMYYDCHTNFAQRLSFLVSISLSCETSSIFSTVLPFRWPFYPCWFKYYGTQRRHTAKAVSRTLFSFQCSWNIRRVHVKSLRL